MRSRVGDIHTVRIRADTRGTHDTHGARIGGRVSGRLNCSGIRQRDTVVIVARVTAGTRQRDCSRCRPDCRVVNRNACKVAGMTDGSGVRGQSNRSIRRLHQRVRARDFNRSFGVAGDRSVANSRHDRSVVDHQVRACIQINGPVPVESGDRRTDRQVVVSTTVVR